MVAEIRGRRTAERLGIGRRPLSSANCCGWSGDHDQGAIRVREGVRCWRPGPYRGGRRRGARAAGEDDAAAGAPMAIVGPARRPWRRRAGDLAVAAGLPVICCVAAMLCATPSPGSHAGGAMRVAETQVRAAVQRERKRGRALRRAGAVGPRPRAPAAVPAAGTAAAAAKAAAPRAASAPAGTAPPAAAGSAAQPETGTGRPPGRAARADAGDPGLGTTATTRPRGDLPERPAHRLPQPRGLRRALDIDRNATGGPPPARPWRTSLRPQPRTRHLPDRGGYFDGDEGRPLLSGTCGRKASRKPHTHTPGTARQGCGPGGRGVHRAKIRLAPPASRSAAERRCGDRGLRAAPAEAGRLSPAHAALFAAPAMEEGAIAWARPGRGWRAMRTSMRLARRATARRGATSPNCGAGRAAAAQGGGALARLWPAWRRSRPSTCSSRDGRPVLAGWGHVGAEAPGRWALRVRRRRGLDAPPRRPWGLWTRRTGRGAAGRSRMAGPVRLALMGPLPQAQASPHRAIWSTGAADRGGARRARPSHRVARARGALGWRRLACPLPRAPEPRRRPAAAAGRAPAPAAAAAAGTAPARPEPPRAAPRHHALQCRDPFGRGGETRTRHFSAESGHVTLDY